MPPITLNAHLETILATADEAGYLQIALCNFGLIPPCIPGVAMLANAGIPQTFGPQGGSPLSVQLWGNDVITPAGTFYSIAVLDGRKNIVQGGCYELTGAGPYDLSNLAPILPVPYSYPGPYVLNPAASGPLVLSTGGWSGPIVFDVTLVGNVTSVAVLGLIRGQFVEFLIRQNGAGNHAWTWPAIAHNTPVINAAPNSVSSSAFVVDNNLQLYPQEGWS